MALTKKLGFDYCYGGAWVMSVDCYRGKKRPGQWGDRARRPRHKRLRNAWELRYMQRAERKLVPPGRKQRRAWAREDAAREAVIT